MTESPPDAAGAPATLLRRRGTLLSLAARRGDCIEWRVRPDSSGVGLAEGAAERAIALDWLTPGLQPGETVWLNATAAALQLGTGGTHFILARCRDEADPAPEFAGREAGHLLKLRYTPLQHRRMLAEEPASPHREAVAACTSLDGTPVLAVELHSQAAAAIIAARSAAPDLRIVLVWLDSAALPLGLSRLVAGLRAEGALDATVTTGQAFGGDLEAVNVYSGLLVARAAAGAELIVAAQGPGNAGTDTTYGFSGLAVVEALHAAATLQGTPLFTPRLSSADPRARHRGLSHHSATILRCLRTGVDVICPPDTGAWTQAARAEWPAHTWRERDPADHSGSLEPYAPLLTTMGRSLSEDSRFFGTAVAAGVYAAELALRCRI